MDILKSTEDPYSFAQPELARVIHTHLELNVDFNRKVLEGKAILTIERKPVANIVILDNNNLDIIKVTNPITGSLLRYRIGYKYSWGSLFVIELPQYTCMENSTLSCKFCCKIEIEYRTSKHSVALVWLTSKQTADDQFPFLLSNTKYLYTRAMFPCQDTPSVKSKYSAKISVPKNYKVIMSAMLKNVIKTQSQVIYEFIQPTPIPAYGIFIAVGSLEMAKLGPRSNVFAETRYFIESIMTFANIESILQIAEDLCGSFWGTYNICVLPPSISPKYFKECPNIIFVSPSILGGDISLVCSALARQISSMWTEYLVTCVNYNHLWLNKSISMFIYKKIIMRMPIDDKTKEFLKRKVNRKLVKTINKYKDTRKLQNLVPMLNNMLPNDAMKYVPYEIGCMLLEQLEHQLGGPSIFEPYLRSYFTYFANKSINTEDWITYFVKYFTFICHKAEVLNSFDWEMYFFGTQSLVPDISVTALETTCSDLAEEWIRWDDNVENIPLEFLDAKSFSDIQKIKLLKCLYDLPAVLNATKINKMLCLYEFHPNKYEIQFHWLLLCIKNRQKNFVTSALKFAIEFCSPNFACPIFDGLYDWPEMSRRAIETYLCNDRKMLSETRRKLKSILSID